MASASASLSRSASSLSSISVSCDPRDLLSASDSLYDSSSEDPSSSEKRKECQNVPTTRNNNQPDSPLFLALTFRALLIACSAENFSSFPRIKVLNDLKFFDGHSSCSLMKAAGLRSSGLMVPDSMSSRSLASSAFFQ